MAGLSRKTVTVLFSDVVDSTPLTEALDPESTRALMARYFDEMRIVIERHGGTVEKYIGDAIMAVFGIPQVHEDDALRAVRAAAEMQTALDRLNATLPQQLATRTALNTGEVVAGDGHTLVTGDAVNVAKRLEEAAGAGEILIGATTHDLVRDAVAVEHAGDLALKGKAATVAAWRVTSVERDGPGHARRLDSTLVGRGFELALLRQAYARAVGTRSCHLFTILGPAGVGKSRLLHELLVEAHDEASTIVGRCLAYGEGVTFWPLREILHTVGDVTGLLDETDARAVASATGRGEGASTEDIFRAVRRLIEAVAHEYPLVLGFDDLHWAEPTLLDMLEHLAETIRDAPVLLVCIARPELLDDRRSWAGGKLNATSILLEALEASDAEQLIDNLGGEALKPALRQTIMEVSEGNPLFLEEMVRLARESPGATTVPPTIHALLTARLERLAPEERTVLAAASVAGRFFSRDAVALLAGTEVDDVLSTLVRKELIRPQRVSFVDGEAYRFRHVLIRDAAYDALPKADRARLHEQLATWLEGTTAERRQEVEELVGWHLEQTARFRAELGAADPAVTARAATALAAAGNRAAERGDMRAAVSLLTRATVLWRDDERARVEIAPRLGAALAAIGELDQAHRLLERSLATDAAAADARLRAHLEVARVTLEPRGGETTRVAEAALEVFTAAGDDLGISKAYELLSRADAFRAHFGSASNHLERALVHARLAGNRRQMNLVSNALATTLYFGPTPAGAAIEICRDILAVDPGAAAGAVARCILGGLEAMQGRLDQAREEFDSVVATFDSLGLTVWLAYAQLYRGLAELGAGSPEAAQVELEAAVAALERVGSDQLFAAAYLARALCAVGSVDEAERVLARTTGPAPHDPLTEIVVCSARAAVCACRGDDDGAEKHARTAVDAAAEGDAIAIHADALLGLGTILHGRGRAADAHEAVTAAVELYERKGHRAGADAARAVAVRLTSGGVAQ